MRSTAFAVSPSTNDMTVFEWPTEHLDVAGLPALTLTMGRHEAGKYLGNMAVTSSEDTREGADVGIH